MERRYFSQRAGVPGISKLDLKQGKRLFMSTYSSFDERHFFQESMGYSCVDAGYVDGAMGTDIGAFFLRKLRKDHLWPLDRSVDSYTRDDLFDVIELLHDNVSEPKDGYYHDWDRCGWHYTRFDEEAGRKMFRDEVNDFLRDMEEGYELFEDGEIKLTGGEGLAELMEAALPPSADPVNVIARVEAAVRKYRTRSATNDDRRDAVRDLGDVLEFLRPQAKAVLSNNDEADLFTILNGFGLRHHNRSQRGDYDPIFMSWLFHEFLATVHAATRLIERAGPQS